MSLPGYQVLVMKASWCGNEKREYLARGKRVVRKGRKETERGIIDPISKIFSRKIFVKKSTTGYNAGCTSRNQFRANIEAIIVFVRKIILNIDVVSLAELLESSSHYRMRFSVA